MHSVPSRESPDRQPLPLVIPANLLEELHSAAHPFRGLRSVPRKTPTLVRHRTEVGPIQAAAPGPLRAAVLILTPSNVSGRILKPAGKTLGLGWVGFHTFRHTCASMLFEAGRNPRQVQAWLGHSDPGFTLRTTCTSWTRAWAKRTSSTPRSRCDQRKKRWPRKCGNSLAKVSAKASGRKTLRTSSSANSTSPGVRHSLSM